MLKRRLLPPFLLRVYSAPDALTSTPAGGYLQCVDIRAVLGKDGAGTFKAGIFFMRDAGEKIEPVL